MYGVSPGSKRFIEDQTQGHVWSDQAAVGMLRRRRVGRPALVLPDAHVHRNQRGNHCHDSVHVALLARSQLPPLAQGREHRDDSSGRGDLYRVANTGWEQMEVVWTDYLRKLTYRKVAIQIFLCYTANEDFLSTIRKGTLFQPHCFRRRRSLFWLC